MKSSGLAVVELLGKALQVENGCRANPTGAVVTSQGLGLRFRHTPATSPAHGRSGVEPPPPPPLQKKRSEVALAQALW